MSKLEKLLLKLLSGTSDNHIGFDELRTLLLAIGFTERTTGGSHRIFTKEKLLKLLIFSRTVQKQKYIR